MCIPIGIRWITTARETRNKNRVRKNEIQKFHIDWKDLTETAEYENFPYNETDWSEI